ncbi:3-oxo-tetronate kinase [Streptomyces triticirhizae]|uniref:3-oxo-tetronate kinase n=1 Tax=Streptomyces triticirhizae TaxID=2483353 RepID=A0A3M2LRA9_9ACTN|nr:3-oxo-tetronate kinase [Streptomyces triticirhizae]RMI39832.1 four-carbon acid sugar kinase family protein [Streptomyces triticirhizae]
MTIALGVVADDFTGATDVAAALRRAGVRTALLFGVPDAALPAPEGCAAVVVALKIRGVPAARAVNEATAAARWLRAAGVRRLYWKYCSTFDSTPRGNIGPVADALLAETGQATTLVCPAAPEHGRTVHRGQLLVHGRPLAETPMRHHPLNPMTASDLRRLLAPQTPHPVGLIPLPVVRAGAHAVAEALAERAAAGERHLVADALTPEDLTVLGAAAGERALLTGAAGLAEGLARSLAPAGPAATEEPPRAGPGAVLAGSCSARTLEQIAHFAARHPAFRIDPRAALAGRDVLGEALAWHATLPPDAIPLLHASAPPAELAAIQRELGAERAAATVEALLAELAVRLVGRGTRRLLVAGGETSGAVTTALRVPAVVVGPEADPGVPWTRTLGDDPLHLMLKSGNFGAPDLFARALEPVEEPTP